MDAMFLVAASYLLLLAVMIQQAKAQALCENDWHLHLHTGSCMRVFEVYENFNNARDSCGKKEGWLATITDSNTNQFVKDLLRQHQKAFFGLYKRNTNLYWVEKGQNDHSYTDWIIGHPYEDYALITRTGWETDYLGPKYHYVCQKVASFPNPSMSCEPLRLGTKFPPFSCSLSRQLSFGSLTVFKVGNSRNERLVECFSTSQCKAYTDDVSGKISLGSSKISSIVSVDRVVARTDDRIAWTCAYDFVNTPSGRLTSSCVVNVFVAPSNLRCRYSINKKLDILCDVRAVYPQATSIMKHTVNGNQQEQWLWNEIKNEKYFENSDIYYNVTLMKVVTGQISEGNHVVDISVFPNVPFSSEATRHIASQIETIIFDVQVPAESPKMSTENGPEIANGRLTVTEGHKVTLICEVNGGTPSVFETTITCDPGVEDSQGKKMWSSPDQRIKVEFMSSREMNEKQCVCTANHVSQRYVKTSTVELDVQFAAQIISFSINDNEEEEIELAEGENVRFRCSAKGNPAPTIRIFQLYSNGKQSRTLQNQPFSPEVSFSVKASYDMSGIYVCSAKNLHNTEISSGRVHLMVNCRPKSCSQRNYDREFSIRPGYDVELEVCVYAYPPIDTKNIEIARIALLRDETYNAKFSYTHPDEAMGIITIKIKASESKEGNYSIYTMQGSRRSKLEFSLVSFKKPSCPSSLRLEIQGSSFVTLSWHPAFDRGLRQTFTVVTTKDGSETVHSDDVPDNGDTLIQYNATGLDSSSGYRFQLSVKNEVGITKCPRLVVNATTLVANYTSENTSAGIVVAIIIIILIVILVVICLVVVLMRGKRKSKRIKDSISLKPIGKEKEEPNDHRIGNGEDDPPLGDIYAQVNKPAKNLPRVDDSIYTNKSAIEMRCKEHDQRSQDVSASDALQPSPYAGSGGDSSIIAPTVGDDGLEGKSDYSKAEKPQPSPRGKRRSEVDTYANQGTATGTDKKGKIRGDNGSKKSRKTGAGHKRKDYAHESESYGPSSSERSVEVKQHNTDLVYVEVEVVPGKERPKAQPRETETTHEEPVAYASVDFKTTWNYEAES
ncbi:hemicentin-1-like [Plakobranchus ocellatus]|uniref:Hemicentin-1-like n=1 Tax=Plakobranchus ocellatus TaxID=259542 RepID=A0AAV4AR13_9GAST|nr:hemicentin-1-like [Plakobranchus ocellatus]